MTDWWNSDANAQARSTQNAGIQDMYVQVATDRKFLDARDKLYDDAYGPDYDPKKEVDKFQLDGPGSMWGDEVAPLKPYQEKAKAIVHKMLKHQKDPLVSEVLEEFDNTVQNTTRQNMKGVHRGKLMMVHDTVYALTQDLVRDAVEHGDLEPSELTDTFLNVDTYGRPRPDFRKLREALEGLPDGK